MGAGRDDMRRGVWIVLSSTLLAGYMTMSSGKPLLTKRAFHRIARECGVTPTEFKAARSGLPYVRFLYRDAAQASDVKAAPSVECVGAALKAYRYEYFGPDADPPLPDE